MDPNTNTPIDPDEPQPLGGPLHPPEPVEPAEPASPPDEPAVSPTQASAYPDPDPTPQVFAPADPLPAPSFSPPPPAPLQSNTPFAPPSNVIMPMQNPLDAAALPPAPIAPLPPQPPLPGAGVMPSAPAPGMPPADPAAPVIVSGGFAQTHLPAQLLAPLVRHFRLPAKPHNCHHRPQRAVVSKPC